jgi:choline dehydrogenase
LNGFAYQLLTIDPTEFTRVSSEVAFLRPALERPNYIVYQFTTAQKILFDGNKTATGVEVSMGKRRFTLRAKKEVIVSAGVFQSPHLLMVSGVGPAAKLRRLNIPVVADRPGVGQNM